jgi:hypothetical protein
MTEQQTPENSLSPDEQNFGMCASFMAQLPISGALVSITDRSGSRSMVSATDVVAARWDELELELGSGPLLDATVTSTAQLIADVRSSSMNPVMGAHLDELGVRAVFTFPLSIGGATVGVAGLYSTRPRALSAQALATATSLARSLGEPAVREALRLAANNRENLAPHTGPGLRREVHQATGMISAQLDVSITEAFARLRAYAISSERPITSAAQDVVAGRLDFLDLD